MAEFGEFFGTGSSIDTSDIRVEYLDYSYVEDCKDVKMLEAILQVLKSGKEGYYPDLENFTEKKLIEILPKKESERIKSQKRQVTPQEETDAKQSVFDWLENMSSMDNNLTELSQINKKKNDENNNMNNIDEDPANNNTINNHNNNIEESKSNNVMNIAKADKQRVKGNDYFRSGDTDKAIECYTKAIEFTPLDPKLYTNRAIAAHKLEKYVTAESDCSKALSLDSVSTDTQFKAYSRRGLARVKQGKYAIAIEDFLFAQDLKPSDHIKNLLDKARTMYEEVEGHPYIDKRGILREEVEEMLLNRKSVIPCGSSSSLSKLLSKLKDCNEKSQGMCVCTDSSSSSSSSSSSTRLVIEEDEEDQIKNDETTTTTTTNSSSNVEAGFKRINIIESDSDSDDDDEE